LTEVVSYKNDTEERTLPIANSRPRADGKVVGRAAQAFNVANGASSVYAGYIAGSLTLPSKGIKDAESVGACAHIFTVVSCQPNSLEVALANPDEEEGVLDPTTAQRFLLGPGDMFRIPPGNCYRIQNHSCDADTFLTWTIIRPVTNPER
jgi:centromere protein C